jgi:hypothetical protein
MGMRRNIALDFSEAHKIYFYTHWGALGLEDCLAAALIRGRERWNDPSYLARIIFSEMVHDEIDGLTGYGIAPYEHDPEYPTLMVDLEHQTVDGVAFEAFIQRVATNLLAAEA